MTEGHEGLFEPPATFAVSPGQYEQLTTVFSPDDSLVYGLTLAGKDGIDRLVGGRVSRETFNEVGLDDSVRILAYNDQFRILDSEDEEPFFSETEFETYGFEARYNRS